MPERIKPAVRGNNGGARRLYDRAVANRHKIFARPTWSPAMPCADCVAPGHYLDLVTCLRFIAEAIKWHNNLWLPCAVVWLSSTFEGLCISHCPFQGKLDSGRVVPSLASYRVHHPPLIPVPGTSPNPVGSGPPRDRHLATPAASP